MVAPVASLDDRCVYLTDGGIETVLIFHEGFELPQFAAFDLLKDDAGTDALRRYYARYLALAAEHDLGFVAESPTWRASPRWAAQLRYSPAALEAANRRAIALMRELRDAYDRVLISGCLGPHDDGYKPAARLSADAAEAYHDAQIATFADAGVDRVTAMTLTYAEEAIGIARAARAHGVPAVIAFTVETDGRLPSGQSLADAIAEVDAAAAPDFYMINCAHPTHFAHVLGDEPWVQRIGGLRANASSKSHAELDASPELDEGDPEDLAAHYAGLQLPRLEVVGGCCGTDHRHVGAIAAACSALRQ
jgi:S-methylmethionine-dependent homocysteine/selenocysteine methylase